MVLAVESPLLFSFRAPVVLGRAQPQQALRVLAVLQVERLALVLFHRALRLDLDLQAECLQAY
jgi:hypothetical protein